MIQVDWKNLDSFRLRKSLKPMADESASMQFFDAIPLFNVIVQLFQRSAEKVSRSCIQKHTMCEQYALDSSHHPDDITFSGWGIRT